MPVSLHSSIDCAAGIPSADTGTRRFGYDAAEESKKRKVASSAIKSEDEELHATRRKRLQASATDIQRNFAIAAWAIRKHLDFVTNFTFSSDNAQSVVVGRDADEAAKAEQAERSQLDDDIEGVLEEAAAPEHCDAAGRHDLGTMLRLGEARATVVGDHGFLELADGSMQAIESDRILTPAGEKHLAVHGVKVDARGRAVAYAVHARTSSGGYKFERWIPAEHMIVRGYFDRFDQVRGISPMAPALNTLRDLYEGFDYALAKAKLAQLFGFKVIRNANDGLGNIDNIGTSERPEYKLDLGKGPWFLDFNPGDDMDIMSAEVPGDSFETYSEMMIAVSLLALDLPWNFYKVDATNFFGSRAALNLYMQSVKPKRKANLKILQRWTRRQLQLAILRGKLRLPRSLTVDQLRYSWTPDGLPWWNPSQEADGALKSIGAGLANPQDTCLETGTNFFRNVDKIAEAVAYAEGRGVKLSFAVAPAISISQQ